MRTPACGYPPKTLDEVYGKVLSGKAMIVEGEVEIAPGVRIHPAFLLAAFCCRSQKA